MNSNQLKTVQQFYPKAKPIDQALNNIINEAKTLGLKTNQIVYADSFCCDEVNSTQFPENEMTGPFKLGGLGGYPFSGVTGMGAFAAHVPESSAALIIYGPHIGITNEGKAGKIKRVGQTDVTNCCGSLSAALQHLLNDGTSEQNPSKTDYQQEMIEQMLLEERERIQQADEKMIETIEVFYEAIDEKINTLIDKTSFNCKYIILCGGIFINSDKTSTAFWAPRKVEIVRN